MGRTIDGMVLSAMTNGRHGIPPQHLMPQGVRGQISSDGGNHACWHDDESRSGQALGDSRRRTGASSGQNGRIRIKNGGDDGKWLRTVRT